MGVVLTVLAIIGGGILLVLASGLIFGRALNIIARAAGPVDRTD